MPIQQHDGYVDPERGQTAVTLPAHPKIKKILIIVCLVMCVVAGITFVLPFIKNYLNDQKMKQQYDAIRASDIKYMQTLIEGYHTEYGYYPLSTSTAPYITSSDLAKQTEADLVWIESLGQMSLGTMQVMDPVNEGDYVYRYRSSKPPATDYELDCKLKKDDSVTEDGGNNQERYEVGTDLTLLD
jgi:hypothetical protein